MKDKLKKMQERLQLKYLDNDLLVLTEYLANPSDRVQVKEVKRNTCSIMYIKDPCEEAQMIAVRATPSLIKQIKNPCEKAQMWAVAADVNMCMYIRNICELAKNIAIKKDKNLARYFKEVESGNYYSYQDREATLPKTIIPDKEQIAQVKQDVYLIDFIENPCEEAQLIVVKSRPTLIRSISEPTDKVVIEAMKRKSDVLMFVDLDRLSEESIEILMYLV